MPKYKAFVIKENDLAEIHIFDDFEKFSDWLDEYEILSWIDNECCDTIICVVDLKRCATS